MTIKELMQAGLADAARAHMIKLWQVAMAAPAHDEERATEAAREGLRKTWRVYEGGLRLIDEVEKESIL
jgi:hypothetical protein